MFKLTPVDSSGTSALKHGTDQFKICCETIKIHLIDEKSQKAI